MVGAREPIMVEDPSPIMEDISGDLYLEGHQTSAASLEATKEEKVAVEVTAAEEVTIDKGQNRGA